MINDFRNTVHMPPLVNPHRTRPPPAHPCRSERGDVRMAVWAGPRGIKKGEEILVSYGKGYWAARGLLPSAAHFGGCGERSAGESEGEDDGEGEG